MNYTGIKLINSKGDVEPIYSIYNTNKYDIADFEDAILDAETLRDVAKNLNKISFGEIELNRFLANGARYCYTDRAANTKYLYLYGVVKGE